MRAKSNQLDSERSAILVSRKSQTWKQKTHDGIVKTLIHKILRDQQEIGITESVAICSTPWMRRAYRYFALGTVEKAGDSTSGER